MSPQDERTSTFLPLFFLSASLLFLIAVRDGQAISLGTLIDTNGSIVQGDKLFDNFRTDPLNNAVVGNASPLDVGDIDIRGITTSGENGLRFSGPFSAVRTDGQAFGRYTIQYDVSVLDPGFLLSDIHHSFPFSQSGFGSGAATTRAGTAPSEGPFAQLSSEVYKIEPHRHLAVAFSAPLVKSISRNPAASRRNELLKGRFFEQGLRPSIDHALAH
jgi:hypothetical protein